MRRVVMFTVLALLLLAVAGVSAAQEGVFEGGESAREATGITAPDRTTPEPLAPEETASLQEPEEAGEGATGGEEPERASGQDRPKGKPDKPGKGDKRPGGSGDDPEGAEEDGTESAGSGQGKVTVCHKGKKTLSVGAPAGNAHLAHGDTRGSC